MTQANTLSINYLLGHLHSTNYLYSGSRYVNFDIRYSHHFPMFTISTIKTMLLDPRIRFGLNLIKGPICTYTAFFSEEESQDPSIHSAIVELNYHFPYAVICKNKKQEEFILRQYNRLWEVGIYKILRCVDWGWSAAEVKYKKTKEYALEFDNLSTYYSDAVQCMLFNGGIVGFKDINSQGYIPLGKGLWTLHAREENKFYGESRLRGAHVPWHETWSLGGARDIRRTWYFRNAYDGGEIYYPEGSFLDENGVQRPNEELAVRMAEMKRSGSTAVFPSTKGLDGKRSWEYEAPKANQTPMGMDTYIAALRDEELEGLGIPPEVVQNSGSQGMGAATGRMVPLMAFISSLTPIGRDIITDFRQQVMDPILLKANGFTDDYEIKRIIPKTLEAAGVPLAQKTVPDSGM